MLGTLSLVALLQVAPTQELAPGARYDPAIPTLEEVVGHGFREEITAPDQVVRYFEALARAAPNRTRLIRYAESWEGRPLVVLVVGSRDRIASLDDVRAGLRRLAYPDGLSSADADALVERLPVVTALMHGVHGNEISSSGAAMAEAYHLLAAQGDPTVDLILRESLVLIDPVENPDGRARFVQHNTMSRARWPNEATYSAEHDEPWPGGRVNHYLFDLNRDLFIQSQPETQGKVDVFPSTGRTSSSTCTRWAATRRTSSRRPRRPRIRGTASDRRRSWTSSGARTRPCSIVVASRTSTVTSTTSSIRATWTCGRWGTERWG